MLHTVSSLGALFGVSILEDKGHAHNELCDVVYQMSSHSCVIFKFSTLSFEYISAISLKSQENHWFLSYQILDKWLWIPPKACLISGVKYYCLYHIIITSIDPINISFTTPFILAVVVAKIWICAREISYVLYWDNFLSMPSNIS